MSIKLAPIVTLVSFLLVGAKPPERRITLDVKDADIHNVLRLLADTGRVNIVVPDEVKGRVTLKLKDVPWTQALEIVLHSRGLGKETIGNVIQIDTLERINKRLADKAEIAKAQEGSADLLTVMIPLNYASASELKPLVTSMLTPRGTVAVDARTNVLIVTDVAHNVARVRKQLGI
jgi:type II secretory pathway component HofQ